MSRQIIVSDVHGCLDELKELLDRVRPEPMDTIVFLGDLLDKGPRPLETLRFVRSLPNAVMVKANHEERYLQWRRHVARREADPRYVIPMRPLSEENQRVAAALTQEDLDWLGRNPPYIVVRPGWLCVHGGLLPNQPHHAQEASKLIRLKWVRYDSNANRWKSVATDYTVTGEDVDEPVPTGAVHWSEVYDGPLNVVVGHQVIGLTDPVVTQAKRALVYRIDTGCVYGGRLTALILGEEVPRFVQVQARRAYCRSIFRIA